MYKLIIKNKQSILDKLIASNNHFTDYKLLIENLSTGKLDKDFEKKYRKFWGMNRAISHDDFYDKYFSYFNHNNDIELKKLIEDLSEIKINNKGYKTAQLSFSSKLLHMKNPHLPIFDQHIKRFYFLPEYSEIKPIEKRIETFLNDYDFLKQEFKRIIEDNLLGDFPNQIKIEFNCEITDEKAIDSIIWAFSSLLSLGAIKRGEIKYE